MFSALQADEVCMRQRSWIDRIQSIEQQLK